MSGRLSFDYVRRYYGVPAKRGMRVTVDGRPGRITSGNGHYIRVRFDDYRHPLPVHPTWRVIYHTDEGDFSRWTEPQDVPGPAGQVSAPERHFGGGERELDVRPAVEPVPPDEHAAAVAKAKAFLQGEVQGKCCGEWPECSHIYEAAMEEPWAK